MSAAQDRILVDDKWYVAVRSARTEEAPQVLKCGESFALFDRFGDVRDDGSGEQGIYREDTRFISRHFLTLGGTEPMFLGANVKEGNNVLVAELMNPDLADEMHQRMPEQRPDGALEIHLVGRVDLGRDQQWRAAGDRDNDPESGVMPDSQASPLTRSRPTPLSGR